MVYPPATLLATALVTVALRNGILFRSWTMPGLPLANRCAGGQRIGPSQGAAEAPSTQQAQRWIAVLLR
ncbi:MAG: hypothetical protein HQL87_08425 [Magnetococcales bacterium]|nr:hypothetical protein [Magnetococcales bacterium]